MAFLFAALSAIREQWTTGDRATAVVIAMLPVWLVLPVVILYVGGTIELALGIEGSSPLGIMIGVIAFVLAGAVLFGGPLWTLRRLGKARSDRELIVDDGYVVVRGVNLGMPDNVAGCATFLVFVGAFLACLTLAIVFSAVYEALGGIPPDAAQSLQDLAFPLVFIFLFVVPVLVVLWARPRIRRRVFRQAGETPPD